MTFSNSSHQRHTSRSLTDKRFSKYYVWRILPLHYYCNTKRNGARDGTPETTWLRQVAAARRCHHSSADRGELLVVAMMKEVSPDHHLDLSGYREAY